MVGVDVVFQAEGDLCDAEQTSSHDAADWAIDLSDELWASPVRTSTSTDSR